MPEPTDLLAGLPGWLLRPLPANAVIDETLEARIDKLAIKLPENLSGLTLALDSVAVFREYDSAANRAGAHVWRALDGLLASESPGVRSSLLEFASRHFLPRARNRVLRRLVKDADHALRRQAREQIERLRPHEVALPDGREGEWNPSGWQRGTAPGRLARHAQGRRVQKRHGLPEIADLADLRTRLGIKSPAQLGYFLLASHEDDGPYVRFEIPKRDGGDRVICAPKRQLRWVQRQILRTILDRVPAHPAAHGFVAGRSTVTNAAAHVGADVVLKFDLTDFFPTVGYYRVMGLFASLGYTLDDGRFSTRDASRQVAPALARLCTYTPHPTAFGLGNLPQGAPTSPALSNLVCRTLDARLDGLARKSGGVYTRYADDLTFSFRESIPEIGRFRWWVDQVCHQEGFFLNARKSRVIRRSQRQTITGIVVNDRLRVPRDERRRFRAILHNGRLHGLASQARGREGFADYLRGFASYIHMVHPEEGAEFLAEIDALLGPDSDGSEVPE